MPKKDAKAGSSTSTKPTSARLLKTGRPLDPKTDDAEVRPKQEVFSQGAAELGPDSIETPQQAELLAAPEEATRPIAVQNGRMLATYVGLGLERDKDGGKLIHLDFSLQLGEEHDGHLPAKVKKAYDWILSEGNKLAQINDIPAQTIDVYLDPKERKAQLHLSGAPVTKAIVSVIEQVGKGKAVNVIRFAFRVLVERDDKVLDFATQNDGQDFWIVSHETQGKLL